LLRQTAGPSTAAAQVHHRGLAPQHAGAKTPRGDRPTAHTVGAELRRAQQKLDTDQLRTLDKQRRQVVNAVSRQAKAPGRELGHKVTDQVATEVE
jgi:hypothetical protein